MTLTPLVRSFALLPALCLVAISAFNPLASQAGSSHYIPAQPSGFDDWSRIVFQSFRDGNWEIYLSGGDGGTQTRLTTNAVEDAHPTMQRGGGRIAFDSNRDGVSNHNYEIYSMKQDGTDVRRLTNNTAVDYRPVWSPDGSRIAFESYRDNNYEIYVMNADGTGQTRLTNNSSEDRNPTWSPDGSRIAWARRNRVNNVMVGEVWVMNANGSGQTRIVSSASYLDHPVWSPDGLRIAFDADDANNIANWNVLYIVDANGSNLQRVNSNDYGYDTVWMGAWSHDNQWLMFTRLNYNGAQVVTSAYIERIRVDGSADQAVSSSGYDYWPDWQSLDLIAPHTTMQPLPVLTRVNSTQVKWTGVDTGPAGIESYDVQYRVGSAGAWIDWLSAVTQSSAIFNGPLGQTIYFRARARDNAGNLESWAANSQAATSIYTWSTEGRVTDVRGKPIPGAQVGLTPAVTPSLAADNSGEYRDYLAGQAGVLITVTHGGYSGVFGQPLKQYTDQSLSLYLLTGTNLLTNGSFEANPNALSSWTVGGDMAADVITTTRYLGDRSIRLGVACDAPCLSGSLPLAAPDIASADMAADGLGNVHVVGTSDGTYYQVIDANGVWGSPELVSPTLDSPAIAVDGMGGVHIVGVSGYDVLYIHRRPDGLWEASVTLATGSGADVAADSRGGAHVVFSRPSGYYSASPTYRHRWPSGVWDEPVALGGSDTIEQPSITMGLDDVAHILWSFSVGVYYRKVDASGTFAPFQYLGAYNNWDTECEKQSIAADRSGGVHAFWSDCLGTFAYTPIDMLGNVASPHWMADGSSNLDATADEQGVVHLVNAPWGGNITYRQKRVNQDLSSTATITDGGWNRLKIAVNSNGIMHVLGDYYHTTMTATQPAYGWVSQAIHIPVDMHEPTLAFMYQLRRLRPAGSTAVEAWVDDGLTTTLVFSAAANTAEWTQGWGDLSPWAGQSVTVSLGLRQAIGDPLAALLLDRATVTSWRTPVAYSVSPGQVLPGTLSTVTISGDNFFPTPTVRLAGQPVTNVTWINEHTLLVTVPGLPVGMHDLQVTNPEGQVALLASALRSGKTTFFPIVSR